MAELSDYTSGKIKKHIDLTRIAMRFLSIPLLGRFIRKKLQDKIRDFHLRCITLEIASGTIRNAHCCAVGERVCFSCTRDTRITESVFLDELAEGMVASGQARFVSCEEAAATLRKYPHNPLIIARISGKDLEICCSYPKDCIYWNMKTKRSDELFSSLKSDDLSENERV